MPDKQLNQRPGRSSSTPLRSEVVSLDEIVQDRGAHLQAALDELRYDTPAGHGRRFCFAKGSSGEQFARSVTARARTQGVAIKTRCQNRGVVVYLWIAETATPNSGEPLKHAAAAVEKDVVAGHRVVASLSFTRPSKPALAALASEPDYAVIKEAADDAGSEAEAPGKRRISFAAACMRTASQPEG